MKRSHSKGGSETVSIANLKAKLAHYLRRVQAGEEAIITRIFSKDKQREASVALDEAAMGRSRKGDAVKSNGTRVRRNGAGARPS